MNLQKELPMQKHVHKFGRPFYAGLSRESQYFILFYYCAHSDCTVKAIELVEAHETIGYNPLWVEGEDE